MPSNKDCDTKKIFDLLDTIDRLNEQLYCEKEAIKVLLLKIEDSFVLKKISTQVNFTTLTNQLTRLEVGYATFLLRENLTDLKKSLFPVGLRSFFYRPIGYFGVRFGFILFLYTIFSASLGSCNPAFWPYKNYHNFSLISNQQDWGEIVIVDGNSDQDLLAEKINTHANSSIAIRSHIQGKRLKGNIALAKDGPAEIVFEIRQAKKVLYTSEKLDQQNKSGAFNVPFDSASEILLLVKTLKNNVHGAHADWINLRVEE